jgi:hypothetical protein
MKKIILLLACLAMGSSALDAFCSNTKHVKVRGKRGNVYHCSVKPRAFYQALKNKKVAERIYDQNGNCRTCGCGDAAHKINK